MSSTGDNNTAPATPSKPSDKQMSFLNTIMQNIQGKPDINWANVVTQSGLKNERTAKEMYRQMTKKFGWNAGSPSASAGGTSTASTPTKVQKRTGKVGAKSAKKVGGKKVQEEEEDDDDDEGDYV